MYLSQLAKFSGSVKATIVGKLVTPYAFTKVYSLVLISPNTSLFKNFLDKALNTAGVDFLSVKSRILFF